MEQIPAWVRLAGDLSAGRRVRDTYHNDPSGGRHSVLFSVHALFPSSGFSGIGRAGGASPLPGWLSGKESRVELMLGGAGFHELPGFFLGFPLVNLREECRIFGGFLLLEAG